MSALPRLAEIFAELASTLVDDYELTTFLSQLTSRVEEVSPASATGLMMVDAVGELQLVVATDGSAHELEQWQVSTGEGPCFDCYRSGRPVIDADLAAGDRWPRFAAHARGSGYDVVHAFPIRLGDQVIGAMNLFATGKSPLSGDDARIVQAMCDVAAIAVLHQRSQRRSDELAQQLQSALDSRVVIEQAKGAIAQQRGIGVDEAFAWLRAEARSRRVRLSDLAASVLDEPDAVPTA